MLYEDTSFLKYDGKLYCKRKSEQKELCIDKVIYNKVMIYNKNTYY